ncbi:hypothetical protein WUBG_03634 [Wuchereria bancrofti]|uniref:Uncharacterized protein n=1 Tax=Wuchereria bancrofti TaxID=6293 RepID=J9BE06_WUCBA|nr:hypothetical protein WUBG_03634 [Wuchereria bancrofti]
MDTHPYGSYTQHMHSPSHTYTHTNSQIHFRDNVDGDICDSIYYRKRRNAINAFQQIAYT